MRKNLDGEKFPSIRYTYNNNLDSFDTLLIIFLVVLRVDLKPYLEVNA